MLWEFVLVTQYVKKKIIFREIKTIFGTVKNLERIYYLAIFSTQLRKIMVIKIRSLLSFLLPIWTEKGTVELLYRKLLFLFSVCSTQKICFDFYWTLPEPMSFHDVLCFAIWLEQDFLQQFHNLRLQALRPQLEFSILKNE